jgi:polar amino acid transport system ATP-binding protein/sulfate transport system ATP-binding protein
VRNVRVSRGSSRVLDGVTFDALDRIREGRTTGQVVSLLGPSGIGKTTLLRVLSGLEQPDRGEVSGPEGKKLDTRSVGVVFQDYPLLPHRTVTGNLVVAGRIGGLDERQANKRARDLLERLGLDDHGAHYPAQLSGGQRQRVAIAQQLVLPRRVLLLDEPFSGLDPLALAEVISLVTEVANEHELNTVVVVTHDVRAALRVSDTIVVLGRGDGGARVSRIYDLVELGVAWEHAAQATGELVRLERCIEREFR